MERMLLRSDAARRVVAFGPSVLLAVVGLSCFFVYGKLKETRDVGARTRDARLAAEQIVSDIKDAETAQRGFLLLGDAKFLGPYRRANQALKEDTAELRSMTVLTPLQLQRLAVLRSEIAARIALIDSTILLRKAGDAAGALAVVQAGKGPAHMDSVRAVISAIDADESSALNRQMKNEAKIRAIFVALFSLGIVVVTFAGVLSNRALLRYTDERERWARQLKQQNRQLEEQAMELELQSSELEAQNSELEASNVELEMLNTELFEARERAEQASTAKSAFLSAMSHELRTPLNAISGYTDLIEAGVYGEMSEKMRDAARRIQANQRHLLSLINQILDFTGIKSKTEPLALQPIDTGDFVTSLDAVIRPQVEAKNLSCVFNVPEPAPVVSGHADALRQVLLNLLTNAVKFTDSPGQIVVSCVPAGDHAEICVRDTGIGMPADKLHLIFEPFVQLDHTHTGKSGAGVGLGLAICKELLARMGGQIEARSVVGAGSAFTVSLPLVQAATPPTPRESSASHS